MDEKFKQKVLDYDIKTDSKIPIKDIAIKFGISSTSVQVILSEKHRTRTKPKDDYIKWLANLKKQADTYWKGKERPEDNVVALLMAKYQNIKTVQSILSSWAVLSKEDKNIFTFLKGEY